VREARGLTHGVEATLPAHGAARLIDGGNQRMRGTEDRFTRRASAGAMPFHTQ